jgi:hypothetical protein
MGACIACDQRLPRLGHAFRLAVLSVSYQVSEG